MSEKTHPFVWHCQKEAYDLIDRVLDDAKSKNHFLKQLEQELLLQTSTRLFDWIDHIEIGYSDALYAELLRVGFQQVVVGSRVRVFTHPGAKLPLVVLKDHALAFCAISIGVESIADFLLVRGMSAEIEGGLFSHFRRAAVSKEQGVFVYVVERRGSLAVTCEHSSDHALHNYCVALQKWQTRGRFFDDEADEAEAMLRALELAQELVDLVGSSMSACIVLQVERAYWQAKNRAGQLQKNRQDSLGMGWANHDHHTFRSSRKNFKNLVRLFEILGFTCRERFYAGKEAGWGAQVMEHATARLVLFLDVDLAPEEVQIDFAHIALSEEQALGTIGLWCGLHGESILKAGMHHLEAQFHFDKLGEDLAKEGIAMMAPFTNLAYLRQAFSVGEHWPVAPNRVHRLRERGCITEEQAARFLSSGALGSHLENLERKEGFKGFHQKSVSDIIHRTDPRNA